MPPKLTPQERRNLILLVARGQKTVSQACAEAGISRTIFYRWLKNYRAQGGFMPGKAGRPLGSVKAKSGLKLSSHRLSMNERQSLVTDYLRERIPINQVAKKYRVSRQSVNYWSKRFLDEGKKDSLNGQVKNAEWAKRSNKDTHEYGRVPAEYEGVILEAVRQYPELGIDQLIELLPAIGNRPLIGRHGVQKVLERRGLNTYERRIAFGQDSQPVTEKIIGYILARSKIAIGLTSGSGANLYRFIGLGGGFVFGLVTALGFRAYWRLAMSGGPVGYTIGFIMASASLFFGMIFFAYSLKYYLTLALVLSFSRDREELNNGQPVCKKTSLASLGLKRWIGHVLGIEVQLSKKDEEKMSVHRVVGLQPDLEGVELERIPFISVHLPMYNEKRVAQRLMKACSQMNYPASSTGEANFELVVCDDSTDETSQIVKSFARKWNQKREPGRPEIIISHRQDRSGFKGAALQKALARMSPKTEFIAIFDADFVPYPDTLTQFVKYFQVATGGLGSIPAIAMPSRESVSWQKNGKSRSLPYNGSRVAVVGGYQWHVLNKSENWLTRGVRTEYAGSYVIERSGQEIAGFLKQISGSVYLARADVVKKVGWGTSITEDFEMTLKLYERGYKVVYTPYVQAPAECVSTLRRLIRQRMRWAEGHSNNIKKMFGSLMWGRKIKNGGRYRRVPSALTTAEKIELIYLSTYYLQAFFFLLGMIAWLLAEAVFRVQLPFWTALWGWSLILTNMLALPLVNAVGLFLEEAEEADYLGLLSFFVISYLLVPFQAYASVKGFFEKNEGDWFRTPKTGRITDVFRRGTFYRFITGLLPGWQRSSVVANMRLFRLRPVYALAGQSREINPVLRHYSTRLGKPILVLLLLISVSLFSLSRQLSVVEASTVNYFYLATATTDEDTNDVSGLYYGGTWQKEGSVVGSANTSVSGNGDHYFYSREYPTGDDDATIAAGTYTANLYKIARGSGAVTVFAGTVSVGYCTGGCDEVGDYTTIGSNDFSWSRSLSVGLQPLTIGTGSPITFTAANPGRVWVNIYTTTTNTSYSAGYNGSTADYISNLQLPTLTVPEILWAMIPVVLMIPFFWRNFEETKAKNCFLKAN